MSLVVLARLFEYKNIVVYYNYEIMQTWVWACAMSRYWLRLNKVELFFPYFDWPNTFVAIAEVNLA